MTWVSLLLQIHVAVSLVGILTGFVVVYGILAGRPSAVWTPLFLATTVLTSVTGFPLPATQLLPSHIVGILSLVLLGIAIAALYLYHLAGAWRWIYVVTAVAAFYLNAFVGVVQSFQKLAFLKPLAPTQSEAPFVVAQLVVLAVFVAFGVLGAIRFHPEARR